MDEKWMNFILNVANKCHFSKKSEKNQGQNDLSWFLSTQIHK
jgi:hypothetical protein